MTTTKRGINREDNILDLLSGKIKFFSNMFNLSAYADESGEEGKDKDKDKNNDESNTQTKTVNYEDLIAKARKEEKDKLYPKIEALQQEVDNWTKKCNQHLIALGNKDKEIEELNKKLKESGKDDSDVVKKLNAEIESLKSQIEDAKKNAPDEKAIEDRIKAEYEVKLYREQKVAEFSDCVIPELVTGTTKEEIDATLENSKKRFKEMSEKILKGTNVQIPLANVSANKANINKMSVQDIANLDPKSPEYKDFRKQLGLK